MRKKLIILALAALVIIVAIVLIAMHGTNQDSVVNETLAQTQTTSETILEYTETTTAEVKAISETILTHEEKLAIITEEIMSSFKSIEYTPNLDEAALNAAIADIQEYKTNLLNNYSDYSPEFLTEIEELINSHILDVDEVLAAYSADLEYTVFWNQKAAEYPVATQIWLSMKEQGWNDNVCAGILGNIMAECGGHTLNIQWNIYDYSGWFYGICQWSLYYIPEASGLSLENQLDLLYNTIESEFDYAGFCYYSGFTYDDFLQMTDYRNAALAFAKVYERCGSASHSIRQANAQIAYEYFAS